ncbi:MAG: PAS domain S-box protein [Alphaproteobacteria bacterium]|nr:PAS domain S-box protein [Alphaproteobacteria bacterium]
MSASEFSQYDEVLARLDRQTASAAEFYALAVDALADGLDCRWVLVVETRGPGEKPILLASRYGTEATGTAAAPFAELPSAPPFRAILAQRYWFVADNLHQQFEGMFTSLQADAASCQGHILVDAAGHGFGYVLALDNRAVAKDAAAAMFFRLVAERISSAWAQEKLMQRQLFSEQRVQDFADAGADWFWEMDAELRISYVSNSFETLVGEPANLYLGKTRREMLGSNYDHEFWDDHLTNLAEHRPFHNFAHPYLTAAGRLLWLSDSGKPVFNTSDDFMGYRCAGSDITAAVLADIELRNSNDRFRDLLDGSPMGISIARASDGAILFVNRRWAEFHGKPVESYLGSLIGDIYPDPAPRNKLLKRMRLEGSVTDEEIQVRHHSGGLVWILTSLYQIEFEGEDAVLTWSYNIHKRKQAETDLRASERRFRDLAEGSIQGMVIIDETWRPLFVNQALADIFGYNSPETILAWDSLSVFFGDAEVEGVRNIISARFNNQPAPSTYEVKGTRKNGETVWLQLEGRVVEWEGRQAVQATAIDITERKAAEDAVRESEQRFHDFAEASADWLWETDARHRVTYVSAGFERSTGISPDRILGTDRRAMLEKAASTVADFEMLRKIDARESIRDFVHSFRVPGSDPLWIRTGSIPVHDRDGNFVGYRGTTANITAEVEARRQLQSIADRYLNAIDSMSDGVAFWDADDRLVICNQRYREFGGNQDHMFQIGMTFEEHIQAAAVNFLAKGEAREAALQDRIAGHRNPPSEKEVKRKNRTISVRERRTPDGGTITISTDVTQQRQIEEQLRQAQKMEAVGHLTGGIAHDFNNLLAVISGNLELLESRARDHPDLSRFIERGLAAADRGARLTQRLLSFSRKQALNAKATTMDRLINNMRDLVQQVLGETIQSEIIISAEPWPFLIDAAQLENAVLNLAINARDAMPGGGTLTIEGRNLDLTNAAAAQQENIEPGFYVLLSVSDTGTGMSEDVIQHAFDPFFTTKDVEKGTGLGLGMVYGFVQQSGGQIRVESEMGRGTIVKIYLPSTPAASLDEISQTIPSENQTGNSGTILVVEDDPEVREITVAMLHELGYSVLETGAGAEAMELIAATPQLDLLLSDVVLPEGMSGRALAENARAIIPDLKVLFMSGYARDAFAADGNPDPGDELLEKPFHKNDLARMIRRALNG